MADPESPPDPTSPTRRGRHSHAELPFIQAFLEKIQRRNVGRVGILYLISSYLLLEIFELMFNLLHLPSWVGRIAVVVVVVGLPAVLLFAWAYEVTPEGLKPSETVDPANSIARHTGRRLDFAIIAVLAVALAYFVVDKFWISRRTVPVASNATSPHALPSIAVLPLANESGDPSQQYFSDGLSESLITALTQFQGLKVIGRASAFQFRDSKEDSRSIGAKLGVARLLEGSVQRAGDLVRVSAELVDTADGSTRWSERYDRPYKDLFALQDDITRAVTGALRTKLMVGEHATAQSERPPSGSLEAYTALLQGRFYSLRETEANYRKAIEFYAHATQIDSNYALAWSGLAQTWANLGGYFLGGSAAREAYTNARAAAERALALSPELAAAHVARGLVLLWGDFDWRGAEAEFRRAIELAPSDADAKFWLGNQLATLGEAEQAVALTRQALASDPLQADRYDWLALYLSRLDRLEEADRAIRKAIELQPTVPFHYYILTVIEIQRGNAQAALAAARRGVSAPYYQEIALALALQIGGDRGAADAALRTLIEKDAEASSYQVAQVYALRNDAKATFEWLDRAWSNRDPGISILLIDPFILRFKDDPRFAAFCRKVGLPVPGERSAAPTSQAKAPQA